MKHCDFPFWNLILRLAYEHETLQFHYRDQIRTRTPHSSMDCHLLRTLCPLVWSSQWAAPSFLPLSSNPRPILLLLASAAAPGPAWSTWRSLVRSRYIHTPEPRARSGDNLPQPARSKLTAAFSDMFSGKRTAPCSPPAQALSLDAYPW